VGALLEIFLEARRVKPEPGGVAPQRLVVEVVLVLVEEVVHLPEAPLRRRGFGGLGRAAGVRVHGVEGKVPEHEAQTVA
jgi:hypothetical protein